jgi:hypothetical protein
MLHTSRLSWALGGWRWWIERSIPTNPLSCALQGDSRGTLVNREQVWNNFDLGKEIDVAGTFIYNGLHCFHEMRTLDHAEEIFEFLYNLSVGLERLLKVAVILLEHDQIKDQEEFERSLITHNHLELLKRVKDHVNLRLAAPHNEFLDLLGTFYRTFRYDRFNLSRTWDPEKEKAAFRSYLERNLQITLESPSTFLPTQNTANFRKHIGKVVAKISGQLFGVVKEAASALNLYTYELRSDSKAAKIFLKGECDFVSEDVLWKELLIFFMNTKATSGLLDYLRSIEPLEFDEALAPDYLQCFQSEEGKRCVMDELEEHYANLDNPGERLEQMNLIGNPMVDFDPPKDEDEEETECD